MAIKQLLVLLALVAVSFAKPQSQYGAPPPQNSYGPPPPITNTGISGGGDHKKEPGMPYDFQWAVNDPESGNDYAHQESSDGNVVTGEYRVLLPDSRVQIVRFTADHVNGYQAEVTYEGEAVYPDQGRGSQGSFSTNNNQQVPANNYGAPQGNTYGK